MAYNFNHVHTPAKLLRIHIGSKVQTTKEKASDNKSSPPSNRSSNFSHFTHIFPELRETERERDKKKKKNTKLVIGLFLTMSHRLDQQTHSLQIPSCRRALRIQCSKKADKTKTWHCNPEHVPAVWCTANYNKLVGQSTTSSSEL